LLVGDLLFSLAHHANISPVSIRAPRALLPLLRERILTRSRRASSYLPTRVPNPPMFASNVSSCQRPVKMRIKVDLSWITSAKDFRSETRSFAPPPLLLGDVIAACALPLARLCRPTSTVGTAAFTASLMLGQSFPTSAKQHRRLCCFVRLLGATPGLLDPSWIERKALYKVFTAV
jgi:hypothetical protein